MANRYAVQDGDWSDTATWDGGTLPQAGDVVRPNGFTVTIDQDIVVDELRNDADAPAVAGGQFQSTQNVNITADLYESDGVTDTVLYAVNAASNVVINGSLQPSLINIGAQSYCVSLDVDNIIFTLNGNSTGGFWNSVSNVDRAGVRVNSASSVTVNGNLTGNSGRIGRISAGIYIVASDATVIVNGTVEGNDAGNPNDTRFWFRGGIANPNSNSTIIINGITSSINSPAINSPSTSTVIVNGVLMSSIYAIVPAVVADTLFLGNVIVDNSVGNQYKEIDNLKLLTTASVTSEHNSDVLGTPRYLYSAGLLTGYPLEEDVEDGVIYGPSDEFEGTLVPVNVDTAQLASDLLDEIQTSSHVVAQRLRASATDDSVGDIVASTLGA